MRILGLAHFHRKRGSVKRVTKDKPKHSIGQTIVQLELNKSSTHLHREPNHHRVGEYLHKINLWITPQTSQLRKKSLSGVSSRQEQRQLGTSPLGPLTFCRGTAGWESCLPWPRDPWPLSIQCPPTITEPGWVRQRRRRCSSYLPIHTEPGRRCYWQS